SGERRWPITPAEPGGFRGASRRRRHYPRGHGCSASREDTMSDQRPRILIVDDEADLRAVLRFGLEAEGFEVIEAADGEEALRRAHEDHPHLMVLDLMLPKLDG